LIRVGDDQLPRQKAILDWTATIINLLSQGDPQPEQACPNGNIVHC
jgi:hypothetical protein